MLGAAVTYGLLHKRATVIGYLLLVIIGLGLGVYGYDFIGENYPSLLSALRLRVY